MTIHVTIGEARARLEELVAAARDGEDVLLGEVGAPRVRLVPVVGQEVAAAEVRAAKRRTALGMFKHRVGDRQIDVRQIKLDDQELQDAIRRKYGDSD